MAKAVLLSIRPEWAGKIASGEKTVEVRKTRPKLETPFKCYIYCTLPKYPHEDFIATDYPNPQFYGGGKVIGEFMCYATIPISVEYSDPSHRMAQRDFPFTGMTDKQFKGDTTLAYTAQNATLLRQGQIMALSSALMLMAK